MMLNFRVIIVFCVVFKCHFVFSFLPSPENTGGRPDFTHASITEDGIYKAVIEKLKLGKFSTDSHTDKVKAFLNSDGPAKNHFEKTVGYIMSRVNAAQRLHSSEASRTMSCEQIYAGNLFLHSLRTKITRTLRAPPTDWGPIRDMLGEYLFTLQQFYSNTNWVEMYGNKTCTELGVKENLSIKISDRKEAMCIDCNQYITDFNTNSCVNNLLEIGHLTSGYTSEQNILKPFHGFPAHTGKCSHGGPGDAYTDVPAAGGINKMTSDPGLSPHHHLHREAGQAAVQATADFLVGEDTGLLYQIGLDQTMGLLGLDYRRHCYKCLSSALSLVLVVDDVWLANEQFKDAFVLSDVITHLARVSLAPFNYVLSTTRDTDIKPYITTRSDEFKERLQSLQSSYKNTNSTSVLRAILTAMQHSGPGSCIFIFTNSDAMTNVDVKDKELLNDVIDLMENKNLRLLQFLPRNSSLDSTVFPNSYHMTENPNFTINEDTECLLPNGNLRNKDKRRKRSNIFEEIASHTSSYVVQTSHSTIGDILGHVLQENMNIHTVGVDSFGMESLTHVFHTDPCISVFTVKLEGSTCSAIELFRPDGLKQSFTGNASKDVIDTKTTILSVQNPSSGVWQVKSSYRSLCHVTVSGSGCIDFDYKILEDVRGVKYPITSSSPVLGKKYTLSVSVKDIPQNLSTLLKINELFLKKSDGSILTSLPVSDSATGTTRSVSTEVILSEPFYVGIKGTISLDTMTREDQKIVTPVGGKIEFVPPFETLVYHDKTQVHVKVSNAATVKQTFELKATDTAGFVTDAMKHVTLDGNQSKSIDFTLIAIPPRTSTKLTVNLNIEGASSKIEQNFMVSIVKPPVIKVTNRSANCKKSNMNPDDCSRQQWEADLTVVFTANMTRLYITPTSGAFIFTYHRDAVNKNKFTATIKGDCCIFKTSIIALDSAGNTKSCPIDFSGENKFGEKNLGFSKLQGRPKHSHGGDSDFPVVWIAVMSALGALAAIGASVALIRKYKSSQNQIKSDSPEFPDPVSNEISNGHSDNSRKKVFTGYVS